jgi:hypothetical protein
MGSTPIVLTWLGEGSNPLLQLSLRRYMRRNIKYGKLEENGEEFGGIAEHIPDSQDIAISLPGLDSDNLKESSEELLNEYAYKKLTPGKLVKIKENQQMRVYGEIEIRGELTIRGDLIVKRG